MSTIVFCTAKCFVQNQTCSFLCNETPITFLSGLKTRWPITISFSYHSICGSGGNFIKTTFDGYNRDENSKTLRMIYKSGSLYLSDISFMFLLVVRLAISERLITFLFWYHVTLCLPFPGSSYSWLQCHGDVDGTMNGPPLMKENDIDIFCLQ